MDDLELREFDGAKTEQTALPPTDHGKDALLFLAAGTFIETLCWGFPYSVGVLHQYWTSVLFADGHGSSSIAASSSTASILTVTGTLLSGFMYCLCLPYAELLSRYPRRRRAFQIIGLVVSTVSIALSGFVSAPWQLLILLGITYPLGSVIFYLPCALLLFEWFSTRRGTASGILYSGTGVGGTVFPLVISALISALGYKMAMVTLGIIYGVIGAICIPFIKNRVPIIDSSRSSKNVRRIDRAFLRRSAFYAFLSAIFFSSLGNFMPSLYLPTFAADLGLASQGSIIISIMNLASVPGLLLVGWLSDRLPLKMMILVTCLGSSFACIFLWGFATNFAMLAVFAVVFGFLGLSFSALWTKLVVIVSKNDPVVTSLVFSLFAFARGIGNILSGPVSNALLKSNTLANAKFGYGVTNHGSLLVYTGLTMVLGSFCGISFRNSKATV